MVLILRCVKPESVDQKVSLTVLVLEGETRVELGVSYRFSMRLCEGYSLFDEFVLAGPIL